MPHPPASLLRRTTVARSCALAALALAAAGCSLPWAKAPLPGAPEGATYATVDGVTLHYVEAGASRAEGEEARPAVVLLHGFASSTGVWESVLPVVAKEHRALAVDLRGFGWSDRTPGDYSPLAQAKLVWALLTQRGVRQAMLVAHSWGSSVALAMALAEPSRVRRIALYDAWVYSAQVPPFFWMAQADGVGEGLFSAFYTERPEDKLASAFFDPEAVPQALVDLTEEQLARPGTTAAALAAVRGHRVFPELEKHYGSIDQPTLLLWGREDRVTTLAMGERLSKELPKAKLVVFPQCGHFPMLEAKNASTEALRAFLAEERAAAQVAPATASAEPAP